MKILAKLQASQQFWFLLITSVVFFLLRLPSLFEPYWYGDEGIYEVVGFALRHGRMLYSGIWDNKPPMLYLIYALFNGDQMGAKALSLLFGLGATLALFFLSKKIFVKFLPSAIATAFFAFFFSIPYIEGNIANAENFMLLPGILAGLLIWQTIQTSKPIHIKNRLHKILNTKYYILGCAGLLLGFSFLIKIVALFDLSAFTVFLFLITLTTFSLEDILSSVKKVLPLIVGFFIPILLCCAYFFLHGMFGIFLHSTLFSNVSYVNYGNQFIIPQGFLILKTLLVLGAVLFFLIGRKKITREILFIFLWIIFALYAALFSGRPYTHYALVILPSASLLLGLIFANKKLRVVTSVTFVILLLFVYHTFSFYSHTTPYYVNFIQYVFGKKNTIDYQAFFDKVTPRDYALAQFFTTHKTGKQSLFVWGNSGQIYKLANTLPPGKFIVAYHVTMSQQNLSETQRILQENPPTFIILLPGQNDIPYSLAQYQERIIIDGATIYEHIL